MTPLVNARAMNQMIAQSRLIIQDGSGVSIGFHLTEHNLLTRSGLALLLCYG